MAIPYYSTDRPSDDPQVRFLEVPAANGAAASNAIKIWFYPGNSVGHEFIWPRDKAMALARATNQSVLTTKTDAEESELTRVDAAGADSAVAMNEPEASKEAQGVNTATTQTAQAETTTAAPAPQRETVGAISGSDSTPAPAPAPERREAPAPAPRTDLPNTAGVLPLLALMGLGSLAGSRLMRRARQ
jgi:hypothetical protein